MNKFFVTVLAMFVSVSAVMAAPSVSVQSVVSDKYVGTDGSELYGAGVIQSDVFMTFENGIYLDIWNSTPFSGLNENCGSEQDLGFGWTGPVPVSDFSLAVMDVGVTYYDEPRLQDFGAGDILNGHVKLSVTTNGITVFESYEKNVALKGSGFEGFDLFSLGVSRLMGHTSGVVVNGTAALGYSFGGTDLNDGLMFRLAYDVSYPLTKKLKLVAPLKVWLPLTTYDLRENEFVAGVGLGYTF